MDSERFDRWAKLLALRMSRRTAATALGAAAVASLTSPNWALGQDDDDDQDDDDQNIDDQGGDAGDDTPGDDDGQDSSDDDQADLQFEVCKDVTRCKSMGYNISSGAYTFMDVGEIPGGPYPQRFNLEWNNTGCRIIGHTDEDLAALCNQTYPKNPDKPLAITCGSTEDGCAPCADFAAIGCK